MAATYLDYVGRIVDVLAFRSSGLPGSTQLQMSILDGESGGEVCTGIQKLAQAWLLEFMTEAGSVAYHPERGCSFMSVFRGGGLLSELDVFQQFNLAAPAIQRNLLNAETEDTAIDERFADAKLVRVTVTADQAVMNVTITSRAGTERSIILPLDIVP